MRLLDETLAPALRGVRPSMPVCGSRICVIVATRGRPALLADTVSALSRQTRRAASVIVSCVAPGDAGSIAEQAGVTVLCGANGLAAQRNAALRQVPDGTDVVVFFDDDFLPRADWLDHVAETFVRHADIGAVTGHLIADGIQGPGLSFAAAETLLAQAGHHAADWTIDSYIPYGCNMAFRWSAIRGQRFDERLVLYGWLEDRDFGATLERNGFRIVKVGAAVGVHMGVKAGRVSGRKLGYSQVVNPLYLARKGTMPLAAVADHLFRNLASNVARSLRPEPHVDRRGRLYGNLRAILDVARGIIDPERAVQL